MDTLKTSPAAATASEIQPQARKQTASTGCPSGELSTNHREGQSENGPISEQKVARQIWSGLDGRRWGALTQIILINYHILRIEIIHSNV